MSVATIPDGELIVGGYLRTHADVEALGTRIVGETPASIAGSWVRLTQINAPSDPRSRVDHLVAFYFQFDCYSSKLGIDGSPQKEAALIGRTVRAVLQTMPDAILDAVVTRVLINGDARIPDAQLEPARERRIITATVWMHA